MLVIISEIFNIHQQEMCEKLFLNGVVKGSKER